MKLSRINVLKATLAVTMKQSQLSKLNTCSDTAATELKSAIKLLEIIQQRSASNEAFVSQLLTMFDEISCFNNLTDIIRKFQRENLNINEATQSTQQGSTMIITLSATQKLEFNRTLVKISDIIPDKLLEIMICISPINHIEREQVHRGNVLFDVLKQHGCISANDVELLFEMFTILGLGKAKELLQGYLAIYPLVLPSDPVPSAPFFATPPSHTLSQALVNAQAHYMQPLAQPRPIQPSLSQCNRPIQESSPPQASPNVITPLPSLQPRHVEPCLTPMQQVVVPNPDPSRSQDSQFRSTPPNVPRTQAITLRQRYSHFPPHQPRPKQPSSLVNSPSAPVQASGLAKPIYAVHVSEPVPPSQQQDHQPPPPSVSAAEQTGHDTNSQPFSDPLSQTPGCFESSGQHHPSKMAGLSNQKVSDRKNVDEWPAEPVLSLKPPPSNPYLQINAVPPSSPIGQSPFEATSVVSTQDSLPSFKSRACFPMAQQPSQTTAIPPFSTAPEDTTGSSQQALSGAQHIGVPYSASVSSPSSSVVVASTKPPPSAKQSTVSIPELLESRRRFTRSSAEKSKALPQSIPSRVSSASKRTRRDSDEQFVTAREGSDEFTRKKLKIEKAPKQKKRSLTSKLLSLIPVFGRQQKAEPQPTSTDSDDSENASAEE